MRFFIFFLFAVLMTVTLTSSANPSWDSIEREIEQDNADESYLIENEQENEDEPEDEDKRELVKRADKTYLSAQKHPERLRECIKCVGIQREKGMNVKTASKHCNRICKRNVFENDDLEKRFYYYRMRG